MKTCLTAKIERAVQCFQGICFNSGSKPAGDIQEFTDNFNINSSRLESFLHSSSEKRNPFSVYSSYSESLFTGRYVSSFKICVSTGLFK